MASCRDAWAGRPGPRFRDSMACTTALQDFHDPARQDPLSCRAGPERDAACRGLLAFRGSDLPVELYGHPIEQLVKSLPQGAPVQLLHLRVRHQHQIDRREFTRTRTKGLARDPLDPVALVSASNLPFRDREAQTGPRCRAFTPGQCQSILRHPLPGRENPAVVFGCQQAPVPAKTGQTEGTDRHAPQAESRLRPLARRALMTARPPRVAIRARKPWVRLRRMLLG